MALIGQQSSDLIDVPDVVLVGRAIQRCTGSRITLIGELSVAMDGVVATPLESIADRRLARAGNAFDEILESSWW
jgi:hypothetical protein